MNSIILFAKTKTVFELYLCCVCLRRHFFCSSLFQSANWDRVLVYICVSVCVSMNACARAVCVIVGIKCCIRELAKNKIILVRE